MRDVVFLLRPGFVDPKYPGQRFFCAECAQVEGVLASFPEIAQKLDIRRIEFPRPRREIIALLGEQHQSCPVLVYDGGFASGAQAIVSALQERHGLPAAHP